MDPISILLNEECANLEENFLLLINISLEEFNTVQSCLSSLFNHQKLFDYESTCEQYILHNISSKNGRIILIISDENICQDCLLRIHELKQVSSIYIRCSYENDNEELNKIWFQKFTKVV
jgi:hypothetical protein